MMINTNLVELRRELDAIDNNIVEDLASRMEIIKRIARVKKDNKIPVVQRKQWEDTLDRRLERGASLGLSKIFIRHFLQLIHYESIAIQMKLIYKKGK